MPDLFTQAEAEALFSTTNPDALTVGVGPLTGVYANFTKSNPITLDGDNSQTTLVTSKAADYFVSPLHSHSVDAPPANFFRMPSAGLGANLTGCADFSACYHEAETPTTLSGGQVYFTLRPYNRTTGAIGQREYMGAVGGRVKTYTNSLNFVGEAFLAASLSGEYLKPIRCDGNGNVSLGEGTGSVQINRLAGTSYTLPTTRGDAGAVLQTDGAGATAWVTPAPFCGGRLTFIGSTEIRLVPYNGSSLFINGKLETIPAAGVSLANTGLTASTAYYIYAYMSGSTMTLEASTTAPTTSTAYGHKVKGGGGAENRTLVGLVRVDGTSLFHDSDQFRFVRSYYNRKPQKLKVQPGGSYATSSTTMVEVTSNLRIHFVVFDDDLVIANLFAAGYNDLAGNYVLFDLADEAGTQLGQYSLETGNLFANMHQTAPHTFSTGYHYITMRYAANASNANASNVAVTGAILT